MKQSCSMPLLVAILLSGLAACTKTTITSRLNGFWKGKHGVYENYPTITFCMLFRENGTVRVFVNQAPDTSQATKCEGSYNISNGVVYTHFTILNTSAEFSTSATVDSKFTFMDGTWGSDTSKTNGGHFFLNKQ